MRKYKIVITDSENKRIKEWKEYHADTAKDAAKIIKDAKRGDLDQIELCEWSALISEYRTRLRISPDWVSFVNGVAIAKEIRDAALS